MMRSTALSAGAKLGHLWLVCVHFPVMTPAPYNGFTRTIVFSTKIRPQLGRRTEPFMGGGLGGQRQQGAKRARKRRDRKTEKQKDQVKRLLRGPWSTTARPSSLPQGTGLSSSSGTKFVWLSCQLVFYVPREKQINLGATAPLQHMGDGVLNLAKLVAGSE